MILKNISKIYEYKGFSKVALDNISLTLPDNGLIFILGKSGSGKSTLLNIIGGIDRATTGSIIISQNKLEDLNDKDLANYRNSYCGFVFQEYNLIENLNVYDNVKLALDLKGIKDNLVTTYLNKVGLYNFEKKKISECSGGEKQRIAIARALIKEPKLILCDEPTAALDSKNSYKLLDILKDLAKDRLIIIVSHNNELANKYADHIIKLKDGKIIDNTLDNCVLYNNHNTILEKSKLHPLIAFKLAILSLINHKFKFISNIILLSLSFLLLIFSLFLISFNQTNTFIKTIKETELSYLKLNKMNNNQLVNLNEYDLLNLNNLLGTNNIPIIEDEISIDNLNYNSSFPYYNIIPRGYTYSKYISNLDLKIEGKLPSKNNEIAISKLLSEIIINNGLNNKNINTILNEELIIKQNKYIITGIIDTNFNNKFDYLKNNNDLNLTRELNDYLNNDLSSLIVFSDNDETNIINISNNPILLNLDKNIISNEIVLINDNINYKIINNEEGIVIPINYYLSNLEKITYNNYYNDIYCNNYYDLYECLDLNNNPYETIINNLNYFKDTFNNLSLRNLSNDYNYKVIGIVDSTDLTVYMTPKMFNDLYLNIGGQFDSILINKKYINDKTYNSLNNMDYTYILDINTTKNINSFLILLDKIELPLIIISITLLLLAGGLFIIYVNQTLIDRSNFIAVLKMLGASNKNILQIVILNILPIVLLTSILGLISSLILYNYFTDLMYQTYNISISYSSLIYLAIIGIFLLLSGISIFISLRKINKLSLIDCLYFE